MNLLGEEVSRLFEGELAAGEHTFTWEPGVGPAAPRHAGVYWCEVRMNGRVQRAGMVVEGE